MLNKIDKLFEIRRSRIPKIRNKDAKNDNLFVIEKNPKSAHQIFLKILG